MERTNNKKHTYSGFVNQNEFKSRYDFIRKRIYNGFSREEVSFLLGRPPYFIIDYEEMCANIKLDSKDVDILSFILRNGLEFILDFDKKKDMVDISSEKRMLRGVMQEDDIQIHHQILHPWEENGRNKPINFIETKLFLENDCILVELITLNMSGKINIGYFNQSRSPLDIFERIKQTFQFKYPEIRPAHVKEVLYKYISEQTLKVQSVNGRFMFQKSHN